MPLIPRKTEGEVRQAPIPGVQAPAAAPLEAFGGGRAAARASAQTEGLAKDASELAFHEQAQARRSVLQMQVQEYAADLQSEQLRQRGELEKVSGKDALQAGQVVQTNYEKYYRDLDKKINDQEVKRAVQGHFLHQRASLQASAIEHGNREVRRYDDDTTKSFLVSRAAGIAADFDKPELVEAAIEQQKAALRDYASPARAGKPPEWVDLESSKIESSARRDVIEQYIATGQDLAAKRYYDQYGKALIGADARIVAEAVLTKSSHAEARRIVDQVLAPQVERTNTGGNNWTVKETPGARTLEEALPRARELSKDKDARVQDLVDQYVRQGVGDFDRMDHERQSSIYEDYARAVDRNPSQPPEAIDPMRWAELKAHYRDALTNRAAKDVDDKESWLNFLELDGDHRKLAALNRADFDTQYWSKFNAEHRKKAETAWTAAREASSSEKAKAQFKSMFSDAQIVLNAMKDLGAGGVTQDDTFHTVNENKAKRVAFSRFEGMVDDAVLVAFHNSPDKKMPDDEAKRKIARDIVRDQTRKLRVQETLNGADWAWYDPEKQVWQLTDEEKGRAYSEEKIPDDRRKEMSNYITEHGGKVTEEKLRRMRAAKLMNRPDLYQKIGGE